MTLAWIKQATPVTRSRLAAMSKAEQTSSALGARPGAEDSTHYVHFRVTLAASLLRKFLMSGYPGKGLPEGARCKFSPAGRAALSAPGASRNSSVTGTR